MKAAVIVETLLNEEFDVKALLKNRRRLDIALQKFGFEHKGKKYGEDYYELHGSAGPDHSYVVTLVDYAGYDHATVTISTARHGRPITSTAAIDIPDKSVVHVMKEIVSYLKAGYLTPNEVFKNVSHLIEK